MRARVGSLFDGGGVKGGPALGLVLDIYTSICLYSLLHERYVWYFEGASWTVHRRHSCMNTPNTC